MSKHVDWNKAIARVIAQHKGDMESVVESAVTGITRLKREIHERLVKAHHRYAAALHDLLLQVEILENLIFTSPREAKYEVALKTCTALACIVALDI